MGDAPNPAAAPFSGATVPVMTAGAIGPKKLKKVRTLEETIVETVKRAGWRRKEKAKKEAAAKDVLAQATAVESKALVARVAQ